MATSGKPRECLYVFNEDQVASWAHNCGYRRLLIQAPDGIKRCVRSLLECLESRGFEVALSASHTWGGCDLALNELKGVNFDAIVHIGHHGPVRFRSPDNALFVPGYSRVDTAKAVERAAALLDSEGIRKVGILTTVQHITELPKVKNLLADYGIKSLTAKSPDPAMPEGIVIGCDVKAAEKLRGKVEGFLVVAGGIFHALGVALATGSFTVAADPYTEHALKIEQEARRIVALRLFHLSTALDSKNALFILSNKPGQKLGRRKVKKLLIYLKKKASLQLRIIVFDDIRGEALRDYSAADFYINSACPRLVTDDPNVFPGPVVNLVEYLKVIGKGLDAYKPRFSVCAL